MGLLGQEVNKDSVLLVVKQNNRAKKKIVIALENRTGVELQRLNPMSPLQLFKWNGKEWEQVPQVGYCSCGIFQCPPPPEMLPFSIGEVLAFDWDQKLSRCLNSQTGEKEYRWVRRGKYKVVFEFKKERYGESFFVEREFRIRAY
jgi:hypothetical protein